MVKRKNGSPGHKNDKKKKRIMISSEKNAPVKAIIPKLEKEAALGAEDDDIIELKREDAIEMSEDEYDNEDSFFKTSFEGDSEDGEEEPEDGISLDGLEAEDDDDLMQDPAILTDSIYQENNEEDEGESGDEHVHGGNCCSSSKVDSVLTDIKVFEQTLFKDNGFFEYQCSLSEPPVNWVKMPFSQKLDSVTEGQNAFEWMIKGIPVSDFLTEMYGKKCVHVKRSNQYYYGSFFSTDSFMKMLDSNTCEFGKNINFATYVDGVRKTPNGKGRVTSNDAKKALKSKMSIQCINPQSFNQNIWYLCDILQEYFQCFVGANNYITPFGSSGFSPHHDEIEGFLLQLEGRKFWRVWAPSDADSMFPIYSSENFNEEQMKDRKPVFSGWLEQGL
uniref:Bifunctional lysine-specific demethylase and histidyl-hydroxylase n=1 Tax=Rhabditophanes sp. KR3021 TaxID=114890 RepID=A0AC35UHB9_9BILA